jgi:hypothetical protein
MVRMHALQMWKLRVEDQSSGRAKALYGNYLQRACDRPDNSVSPSGRDSQTGKIFSENLENSGRTVVRQDGSGSPSGRRPYKLL